MVCERSLQGTKQGLRHPSDSKVTINSSCNVDVVMSMYTYISCCIIILRVGSILYFVCVCVCCVYISEFLLGIYARNVGKQFYRLLWLTRRVMYSRERVKYVENETNFWSSALVIDRSCPPSGSNFVVLISNFLRGGEGNMYRIAEYEFDVSKVTISRCGDVVPN